MEFTKVEETDNPLLERKEIKAVLQFEDATPSRGVVIAQLAKKYHTKEDLIVIKKMHGAYGQKQAVIEGSIYNNEKAVNVEPLHLRWRALSKDKKKEAIETRRKAKKDRKKKAAQ